MFSFRIACILSGWYAPTSAVPRYAGEGEGAMFSFRIACILSGCYAPISAFLRYAGEVEGSDQLQNRLQSVGMACRTPALPRWAVKGEGMFDFSVGVLARMKQE